MKRRFDRAFWIILALICCSCVAWAATVNFNTFISGRSPATQPLGSSDKLAAIQAGVSVFLQANQVVTLTDSQTLTNKTFNCSSQASCTIRLGSDVTGVLGPSNGGLGMSSYTSGGVICATATNLLTSSSTLTANLPVIGGGSGVCPVVGSVSGNTTKFATIGAGTIATGTGFVADGNGNIIPSTNAALLTANQAWLGQNSEPPCPWTPAATLTPDASTCANKPGVSGVGFYYVTLNQTAALNCPTSLPATDGFVQTYLFQQPATAPFFGVNPANCYKFPGGTFALSQSANAQDQITCWSFNNRSQMNCGVPQLALASTSAAVPTISIVTHSTGASCGASLVTSCTATLTVTNGDTLVVGVVYCETNCTTAGTNHVTSITGSANLGTCTVVAGTQAPTAQAIQTEIWWCPITGSGSITVTENSASGLSFAQVFPVDVSGLSATPDDGTGNFAAGSPGPSNVSTNGATPQNNEMIFSMIHSTGGGTSIQAGAGYTALDGAGTAQMDEYNLTNTAGTNAAATTGFTAAWGASIAGFKHQ